MSGDPLWRRYLRFWGPDPAADVDDEFAFHIDARVAELVARGMSPAEARREALRGFGNIAAVKQVCTNIARGQERAARRGEWRTGWRQDLRSAIHQFRASPVLSAVVILTLALGIGATVSVFSVVNAVILRPLPFADSERIVFIRETSLGGREGNASVGHFHDWAGQGTVFEHTAAQQNASYNLGDGEPERVSGARVTPGYFRVLEIAPAQGRYFTEADIGAGAAVAVLGYGLWQQRFGADPSIVGRTIQINDEPHAVVGVAAPEHTLTASPRAARLWTPLVFTPQERHNYASHAWTVLARLKPGVTREAAQADMERVTRGIAERHPKEMEGRSVAVRPAAEVILGGRFRSGFFVLFAAVVLVLLIGCVNVANLLLARAANRRREIAIRAAIGGSRWRIVRQLLTESLALAAAGGAAGVALAYAGVAVFVRFGPVNVPRLHDAGMQTDVLLFALLVTTTTGVVFGLAPALRAARADLLTALREGGRSAVAATRDRLRLALVVGEIALALVLLVGAGLLLRSAWELQQVPLGFNVRGSVVARVALPPQRYEDDAAVADAYRRMLDHLRGRPGIAAAGASTIIPLTGGQIGASVQIEGKPYAPATATSPDIRLVTDGYFEAMGMSLRRGRTLRPSDLAPGAAPVVLINERLAALEWPDADPVGRRLSTWTAVPGVPEWREVVGVIGDVRTAGPDTPAQPEIFIPFTQPPAASWTYFQRSMSIVARAGDDPGPHAESLRQAVWSVDPTLPLFDVQTMESALAAWSAGTRFSTWLLSTLAGSGLLLAAIGIYGVVAYFVAQRRSEIGLRLALGATSRSIVMMVLRQGASLAAAGIVLGFAAAAAAARLIASLLFGVTPTDALAYGAGAAGLFAVALAASVVPARRALRVDPVRSLNEA